MTMLSNPATMDAPDGSTRTGPQRPRLFRFSFRQTGKRRPRLAETSARRRLWASGTVVALYVLVAVVGPFLVRFDPVAVDTAHRLLPPGTQLADGGTAVFGTDQLGQDVLAQTVLGARTSLVVGVAALALQIALGVTAGLFAGYWGGWLDNVLMRLADIQLAFPGIVLAILIASMLGPSMLNVIIVLGVGGWVTFARVTRAQVMATKNLEYVDATRTLGAGTWHLLRHCILPACIVPTLVIATLDIGGVILAESSLSFLGLGVPSSMASWGGSIATGREYLGSAWWISTIPGAFLALLIVALGVLGDTVRDRLDPNLKGM